MSTNADKLKASGFYNDAPVSEDALELAIRILGERPFDRTEAGAIRTLMMIKEQMGCEHFGEGPSLTGLIDVVVFG
jgi:hypothetical protein